MVFSLMIGFKFFEPRFRVELKVHNKDRRDAEWLTEEKNTEKREGGGRGFNMMMLTMANLKVFSDSFSHTWSRSPRRSFGLHWSFIERHWFVEIISKPPERKKPQKLTVNEGDFSRPPTETQPLTVTVSTNTHTQANKRKKGTQNGWNLLWMPAYSVLMDLGSFDFQDRPWDRRARDVSHPQEQMCPLTHPFPWSALFLTQALTFGSLFPSWNKKN